MNKENLSKIKERLEKTRADIEKELEKFAEKDEKVPGDWDTRFPRWDGESGGSALERAANEVEEYSTLLPIEHSLETRLKDISSALSKIQKGTFGKCEKCKKEIDEERLMVYPEAKFCVKCDRK